MEQKLVEVLTRWENEQDMCAIQATHWLDVLFLNASKNL